MKDAVPQIQIFAAITDQPVITRVRRPASPTTSDRTRTGVRGRTGGKKNSIVAPRKSATASTRTTTATRQNRATLATTAASTPRPVRLSEQARYTAQEFSGVDSLSVLAVLALYRAHAVLDRHQTREIATTGLNTTQWNVLTVLHRMGGPVSMGDLGTRLAVRPTNLSGIVNALAQRGLVQRLPNANDRRSLEASLTTLGKRYIARLLPDHYRRMETLMGQIPDRDRKSLIRLLARTVNIIGAASDGAGEPTGKPIRNGARPAAA